MKNITKLSIFLMSLFMLSSCENYLNLESPDLPTTDQVWVSYDAAESYLVSTYSYVQSTGWRYHEYLYLPQNFRADDLFPEYGTTAWGYLARTVTFNNTAASSVSGYMWRNWYRGVKLANDVIENVEGMDMITQAEKNELISEAKFLRAFYFFNLQINFHSIIMPLEVAKTPDALQISVSSRDDVFAQIIVDLTYAAENLPTTSVNGDWGRASANAAYAFLGKAHLYQNEHQKALDAFAKIDGANLVDGTKYRSMFDGTLEQNEEVLFSRGYTAEQMENLGMYHQLGVAFAPDGFNGGWNMASISDYYMQQLESGDIRKEATVLQNGDIFDGETISFPVPNFNMCIKYVESLEAIRTNRSVVDIILMRYAGVLLMQAEANYELGNTAEALSDINKIRARAGLAEVNLSGEDLLNEIRKQRMIELVGEGSRFYDLVRWNIIAEQLELAGQSYHQNFEEKHKYFPIPLEETQRNKQVEPTAGF